MKILNNNLSKIIIFFFLFTKTAIANQIYIVNKINNQIITNIDVENEKKYLSLLNVNLNKLSEKDVFFLAKNSLIREKIKEIEIKKYFNLDNEYPFVNNLLNKFFLRLNLNNIDDFKNLINQNGLNYIEIKNKIKIEALWNNLVFQKYADKVEIDEKKIKSNLKNKKTKLEYKSYLISEILFKPNNVSNFKEDYNKIIDSISKNGFNNTATKYSLSETSKFGGKIGFIREDRLDQKILNELKKLNKGEMTPAMKRNSGYLILKVEDIKKEKIDFDFDNEYKKIVNFEKNKKLNQFSMIYFNKVKSNILIK